QDISFMNTPRMVYRIIFDVNTLPTEKQLSSTATYLWENGNKTWKEFTVFMYLPEMNTESIAYGVAEFNNNGLIKLDKNDYALAGTKWVIKEKPIVKQNISNSKTKEYTINLSASIQEERKVNINITTDFPDGVNFLLTIERIYFLKGDSETYAGELFNKDIAIRNGKFETIIDVISDTKWYSEHQRLVKALPNDIQPISKISDNITIDVRFSSARTQLQSVLKITGNYGEFVSGKGAEKLGKLTTYQVSKELYLPFKK
ncbi:MAG: hypothetical protein U1C46_01390, partial [Bacteroidales bacterium]|nr:hypothetical protein [Bacteroidales bacterium]